MGSNSQGSLKSYTFITFVVAKTMVHSGYIICSFLSREPVFFTFHHPLLHAFWYTYEISDVYRGIKVKEQKSHCYMV